MMLATVMVTSKAGFRAETLRERSNTNESLSRTIPMCSALRSTSLLNGNGGSDGQSGSMVAVGAAT